ncbi:MAG: hypothetical protein EBV27_07400, partial [Actinobacteria bacterium]|nr:hypothetical protein [Actinomycetota bacterium]
MIANEVFIDSATLRENVVALAKNIGYTPRSRKASRATIDFFIDTSSLPTNPSTLTLKAGPVVATSNQFGNQSYVFGILEDKSIPIIDNIATFKELEVIEGTLVNQSFQYSTRNPNQRFILPNAGIDISTLVVKVKPTTTSTISVKYTRNENFFEQGTESVISGSSRIYFVQEIEDEQYEIIFGDGVFGKNLEDGNVVEVSYLITSGE